MQSCAGKADEAVQASIVCTEDEAALTEYTYLCSSAPRGASDYSVRQLKPLLAAVRRPDAVLPGSRMGLQNAPRRCFVLPLLF